MVLFDTWNEFILFFVNFRLFEVEKNIQLFFEVLN